MLANRQGLDGSGDLQERAADHKADLFLKCIKISKRGRRVVRRCECLVEVALNPPLLMEMEWRPPNIWLHAVSCLRRERPNGTPVRAM